MKKTTIYSFVFLCLSFSAQAQKETNIWYFGFKAGLDFNQGAPVPVTDGLVHTNEGSSVICDSNGNLLFYSDGSTAWNKNHQVMPNGTNLGANTSTTQSALIIPQPGSATLFYLFTNEHCEGPVTAPGFQYCIIDITLDGGNGDVIVPPTDLSVGINEHITSCRHANGNDIWVISTFGNTFYAFLLTTAGLNTTPVLSTLGPNFLCHGHLKTSLDGKKIAVAGENRAVVYDFNNATGILTNAIDINNISPYGAEFSPDGKKLYLVAQYPPRIYQYNLEAGNQSEIENSLIEVGKSNGSLFVGALQLGPDQRIYASVWDREYLDVIHNPNADGLLCNFEVDGIGLALRKGALGLPNFYQGFLEPVFTWVYSCSWEPTYFTITDTTGIQSVTWNFGDPSSGSLNTSTEFFPSHIYSSNGTYQVTLLANHGSYTDSVTNHVTIHYTDSLCEVDHQEFLPLAFSPNGDGINDVLFVRGNNISEVNWYVFDRWGQAVFTGVGQEQGWDGKVNGTPALPGTYAYKLDLKLKSGTEKIKSGKLVIVK